MAKQQSNANKKRPDPRKEQIIKLEPFFNGTWNKGAGRPSEGLESLPEDWKQQIITMYSNGASDVEVKATIYLWRGSFSNTLWDRWIEQEPEFSETIKIGKVIAEAWYTKLGREMLQNGMFPYAGWYMQMKNRFGWKDKHEISNEADNILKIEVVRKNRNIDHAHDSD